MGILALRTWGRGFASVPHLFTCPWSSSPVLQMERGAGQGVHGNQGQGPLFVSHGGTRAALLVSRVGFWKLRREVQSMFLLHRCIHCDECTSTCSTHRLTPSEVAASPGLLCPIQVPWVAPEIHPQTNYNWKCFSHISNLTGAQEPQVATDSHMRENTFLIMKRPWPQYPQNKVQCLAPNLLRNGHLRSRQRMIWLRNQPLVQLLSARVKLLVERQDRIGVNSHIRS